MMIAVVILIPGLVSLSLGQGGNQSTGAQNGQTARVPEIPFENLTKRATFFESKGVSMYRSFLYDYLKDQIYIGAKDALLRLDSDLKLIEKIDAPVPEDVMKKCKVNFPEEDCHNFISVLQVFDDNEKNESMVYACGTHGFAPKCYVRDANELAGSQKARDLPGGYRAPVNPNYRGVCASWLNPDNKLLFLGAPQDPNVLVSTIAVSEMSDKPTYKSQKIRDTIMLQGVEFAGTFQERQFVFFVLHEKSEEKIDKTLTTSRIGRLCADGDGPPGLVSFTKVQLECGDYNSANGMYYIENEHKLFVSFSKEAQGVVKSAICLYDYNNISKAFEEGGFLCRRGPKSAWTDCPPRALGPQNMKTCYGERNTEDWHDRILKNTTVHPFCGGPMFEAPKENTLFGRIVVQRSRFGYFDYKIYVADDRMGTVWNVNLGPYCGQSEVYEIWEVTRDEDRKKSLTIQSLNIIYNSVYVLTCCSLLKYSSFDYIPSTERPTVSIMPFSRGSPGYIPLYPTDIRPHGPRTTKPPPVTKWEKSTSVKLTGSFFLTTAPALKICLARVVRITTDWSK